MAIGRLAETLGAANSAAGNYDVAVAAPASTPSGVCVLVHQNAAVTDNVTSVSYGTGAGAVLLTERRFFTEPTEPGALWVYWASGVAFPTGAQTVRIVRTGTTNMRAAVCPMTCATGFQVAIDADATGISASVANPSWSMVTTATATACYLVIHSGLTTMTTTPAANWTLIGSEDIGAQGRGFAYRVMAAAGETSPGWNSGGTADDFGAISVAFKEAPLGSPPAESPGLLQRSPRPVEQGQLVGPAAPTNPTTILYGG